MMTVATILALAALIIAILSAIGKAPLWVAVILLSILELIAHIPLR